MIVVIVLAVLVIGGLLIQVSRLRASHARMAEVASRQVKAESALWKAQSIAHIGSWEQDLVTDDVEWSDEAFRILGLEPGSFKPTGTHFIQSVHPEDQKKVLTAWAAAVEKCEGYMIVHRVVRPDGSVRHVRERADIVVNADGKASRVVGTIQDITDQVEAERALAESEQYFRSITENALDLITIIDSEGTITYESPSLKTLFGYEPEELVGLSIYDIVHRDDYDELLRQMTHLINSEDGQSIDDVSTYRFRHIDGHWLTLESVSQLLPDTGDGMMRRAITINRDVTARLKAEQQNRAREQLFKDFAQASSDWFWEVDENLCFVDPNTLFLSHNSLSLQRIFPGRSRMEAIRENLTGEELADSEKWAEHERVMAAQESFKDFRYARRGEDGVVVHVRVSGVPFYNADGQFSGYRGTVKNETEEVQTRTAHARISARLRDAVESLQDGLVLFDSNDRVVTYNSVYFEMVDAVAPGSLKIGASFEELLRDWVSGPAYVLAEAEKEAFIEKRLAAHRNPPTNRTHQLGDGRWVQVAERRTSEGGLIIVQRDVSETVAIENELRESETRLEDLLELAPEAIIVVNEESLVQIFNKGAEDVFGYAADEVVGQKLDMLIPVEFQAGHHHRVAEFGQSDEVRRAMNQRSGIRARRKDGTEIHAEASISKLQTPDGKMFTVLLRDITQRKQIEAEVEEQRRILTAIVTNLPAVFALKDTEFRYVMINHEFESLFDLKQRDVVGRTAFELMPEEFASFHNAFEQQVLSTGLPSTNVTTVDRADGQQTTLITKRFPIADAEGELLGIALIGTDVTDLKNTELSLRRAQHEAELANRAKSEFLANMSHELRTPLNAILGFSEMLMQSPFGPLGDKRYAEYSDHIHDSGSHLLEIINDILDLSRIEAGQLELNEEDIDIEEAANRVSIMLRGRADSGEVKIRNKISRKLALLHADHRIFRQILLNLMSNAIKFTQAQGEVEITASADKELGMMIEIRDHGIGISAEDMNRVLQPFGQVDGSFSRKYEGVGLGLPLTKSFVEMHGGQLSLESELGVGTTVKLRFPPSRVVLREDEDANQLIN